MNSSIFTTGPTWRAIGMDLSSEERADEVLAVISDKVELVAGDGTGTGAAADVSGQNQPGTAGRREVYRWADRSGAVVVFDVADGEKIADLRQGFAAGAQNRARYFSTDKGFALVDFYGMGVEAGADAGENTAVAQAAVKLETGYLYAQGVAHAGILAVTGLAQSAQLYSSEAEYDSSEFANQLGSAGENGGEPVKISAPFFISTGSLDVLATGNVHAGALLAGTVKSAELHSNTMTGQNFWVLEVNATFDLVLCVGAPDLPRKPVAGDIIAGEFAITAQPVDSE